MGAGQSRFLVHGRLEQIAGGLGKFVGPCSLVATAVRREPIVLYPGVNQGPKSHALILRARTTVQNLNNFHLQKSKNQTGDIVLVTLM